MKFQIAATLLFVLACAAVAEEAVQEDAPLSQAQIAEAKKNKAAGEAFLEKNAKTQGTTVLPDGLQYRIVKTGTGKIPSTNELVFIKYRGRLIDGTEFAHHNRFLTWTTGGIKGWQESIQKMKVGTKWQIFVPSSLAFGDEGDEYLHVPPGATLIYDMELLSIAPPNPELSTGGLGHGLSEDNPGNSSSEPGSSGDKVEY